MLDKNSGLKILLGIPSSQKIIDVGLFIARLFMAFVFIKPGISHTLEPAKLGQGVQMMTGLAPSVATNMALLLGIGEIIAGILIAIGLITRISAVFQIFILIGAQMMFGFDYSKGPAVWKDPGLLGLAIVFLVYGSGRLSLDYLIVRSK
jgi:uncharacterized membrane protein YphA (DoxX/SURF4 family)